MLGCTTSFRDLPNLACRMTSSPWARSTSPRSSAIASPTRIPGDREQPDQRLVGGLPDRGPQRRRGRDQCGDVVRLQPGPDREGQQPSRISPTSSASVTRFTRVPAARQDSGGAATFKFHETRDNLRRGHHLLTTDHPWSRTASHSRVSHPWPPATTRVEIGMGRAWRPPPPDGAATGILVSRGRLGSGKPSRST